MCFSKAARTVALLATILLPGCAPARFDDLICQTRSKPAAELKRKAFASGYFPAEFAKPSLVCGFSGTSIIDDIESDWYPRQWQAAAEPSFYELVNCEKLPDFSLRFSYIPSFEPSIFIRIQGDRDRLKLIAKEMTGAGGYDPGTIGRSKEQWLTKAEVRELRRLLDKHALFKEPSMTCEFGFDGSEWIFEKVEKDGYKMVKRWSPREGAAFDLGQYLMKLSGWRFH